MSRISGLVGRVLGSPPQGTRHKLHVVRFGRLIGSLRCLVELGDDASDKLGGEWILDRSYVASFVGHTLDRARQIVFDSAVLTGEASADLHARLDAVRRTLDGLMTARGSETVATPAIAPTVPGGDAEWKGAAHLEEPEYRLLHAAIQRLSLTADLRPGLAAVTEPRLAQVVEDAHERAVRSFGSLHFRSWGRPAGQSLLGSGFPGPVRVVDAGGGLDAHRGSRVGWDQVASEPLRALLGPLAASAVPDRETPGGRDGPGPLALALVGEGRATVAVHWPTGALLIDARLEGHAGASFTYCALRGEPPGRAEGLESVLADSGARRLELGPGLTSWLTGRTPDDTAAVLGRLGRSLDALLLDPPGGSRGRPSSGRTRSGEWRA